MEHFNMFVDMDKLVWNDKKWAMYIIQHIGRLSDLSDKSNWLPTHIEGILATINNNKMLVCIMIQ